ncbi:DUF2807 domain-containing protein [Corallococcus sp. H22C18031201]|uniref:head GIN domain-containing protein n=1 Tax=Citreicoccus inhibens TaxID=2849499 RepID=UPI000E764D2E|nr:head GIN domain-containing protein [Citreicoccus inhibens]MBU8897566.1 DUF2807 domain-containing protein [Citreicoccus inhibens]RJS19251.1 DUF2807 domain-containing protein [Corallococcus sp. H22C18031201]
MDNRRHGTQVGLALLWVLLAGCGEGVGIQGNGTWTEETREPGAFLALAVEDDIEAMVVVAPEQPIEVRVLGDENLVARVRTRVEDHRTLRVSFPGNWTSSHPLRVQVRVPVLQALSRSGTGAVDLSGDVTGRTFELEASGGGAVKAAGLAVDNLLLDLSGDVDACIQGTAARFQGSLSGATRLQARELAARDATLTASGSAHVRMHVWGTLGVTGSGAVAVYVSGSPQVLSSNLSGGSSLTLE